jgi:hypothetical protein
MRGMLKKKVCSLSPLRFVKIISLTIITLVLVYAAIQRHKLRNIEHFESDNDKLNKKLLNDNDIKFLNEKEFENQMKLSDVFFKYLTTSDLHARNTSEVKHEDALSYAIYYRSSFREMTENEKKIVIDAVIVANKLLINYPNLRDLKWMFAKVNDGVENNWPHTHNQAIILNSQVISKPQDELVETLIHEKIHIYQRVFASNINDLYTNYLSFTPIINSDGIKIPFDILERMRSNPDLNKKTYMFNKKFYIAQLYNSASPVSLSDSKVYAINPNNEDSMDILTNNMLGIPSQISCQLEHPNEISACIISKIITKPNMFQDPLLMNNNFINRTMQWMKKNL